MHRFFGASALRLLPATAIAMATWWVLTLMYPPLVVPTIPAVAARLVDIAVDPDLRWALWLTATRLFAGLGVGLTAGIVSGAVLGFCPRLHAAFRPLVGLAQAVPPVSWLVLALLWFGFGGAASVFIVAVGTFPPTAVTVIEGVQAIDAKLMDMARVYRFSRAKRVRHIILPSLLPYIRAGVRVAVGIGCKTVIMGEVLTAAAGVGGEITNARLNLEPEGVFAWTLAIVAVYFALDRLAALTLRGRTRNACHSESGETLRGAGGSRPDRSDG